MAGRKLEPYNTKLLQKALVKWRGFGNPMQLTNQDFYEFANFIGYAHNPHRPDLKLIVDTDNPEVRRIIDMINGPNGDAILAILKVRHEDRTADNCPVQDGGA